MKKAIILLTLLQSLAFAKDFTVKAGVNLGKSNTSINGGLTLSGEYNKKVLDITNKLSLDIAGGADIELNYGKGIEITVTDFDKYRNKNLLEEYLKIFSEIGKDNKDAINDAASTEGTSEFIQKIVTDNDKDYTKIEKVKNEMKVEEKISTNNIIFGLDGYVLPKLRYALNDKISVTVGLKLGLGYEYDTMFKANTVIDKEKMDLLSAESGNSKKIEENLKPYLKDKNSLNNNDFETATKTHLNDKGLKKIDKNKFKKSFQETNHYFTIPVFIVTGFDYGNLTTNLEIGGKGKINDNPINNRFDFKIRLNTGYMF